jgi:hypothetical protein
MAQAAVPGIDAQILKEHPEMQVTRGAYTFAIHREGQRVMYSVSDGTNDFSVPIAWAFGFGSIGQTYVYEYGGDLYESEVSFYAPINGLDITIGHGPPNPASVVRAAGRLVPKPEMGRCFECHTTGGSDPPKAGVLCERCHIDAQEHARTFGSHSAKLVTPGKLSQLSKDGLSNFCGACHRTFRDIVGNGTMSIDNVRSPAYRLATSKCYQSSEDKRISCVACHDPHRDLVKTAAYYDSKCQACHAAGASIKLCPVAKRDCVTCHMPVIDFPNQHSRFTDHRIRIVVPGAPFPI